MGRPLTIQYAGADTNDASRAACYKQFEREIEAAYQNFELIGSKEKLNLDVADLERYLTKMLSQQLGVEPADLASDADLFAAGIDSLQAIIARATIVREIDLGGKMPGQNVVFDHPKVVQLAKYLHSLRTGSALETETEEDTMRKLVSKYSNFTAFKPGVQVPVGEVVVSHNLVWEIEKKLTISPGPYWSNWLARGSYPLTDGLPAPRQACVLSRESFFSRRCPQKSSRLIGCSRPAERPR